MINILSVREILTSMRKQTSLTNFNDILNKDSLKLRKADRQMANLTIQLELIYTIISEFNANDFSRKPDDFDVKDAGGEWCPWNYLSAYFGEAHITNLPDEISKYTELVEVLDNIGSEGLLDEYDLFVQHIRAMITLKRPFSEMVALFD